MNNIWIKSGKKAVNAKYKLLCIPYAGAGASKFSGWQKAIGNNIEILPVQLPGRENRIQEQCMTDCEKVVECIIEELLPIINGYEFAVFGHSMGAIIGYELVKELQRRYNLCAKFFFVSASYLKHENEKEYISRIDENSFIEAVQKYGGISEEMLKHAEFKEYFVNILRNDFALIENYIINDHEKAIHVPIRTYAGKNDEIILNEHIKAWREYTDLEYSSRIFDGGHFFISEFKQEICNDISEYLQNGQEICR